jgi:phage recombination protein Bet
MAEQLTPRAVDPTPDEVELVRQTICKDGTDEEMRLHLYNCKTVGVHPLSGLLVFTKRGGKYTPVTSIDLMRSRAAETHEYAGSDDAVFEGAKEDPHPTSATVTVYRFVQQQRVAFTATARWDEYVPAGYKGLWEKMPHVMLSKCAEALALRKGFPVALQGLYTKEEFDQARTSQDTEGAVGHVADDELSITKSSFGKAPNPPLEPAITGHLLADDVPPTATTPPFDPNSAFGETKTEAAPADDALRVTNYRAEPFTSAKGTECVRHYITLSDGREPTTIFDNLGEIAKACWESKAPVTVETEPWNSKLNLTKIQLNDA